MIHQHIATNDTTLHCIDHGAGPLVVLLHGFPETWWSWRHQIPELARAGYRIVAVDLRGYGDSDKRGPYGLPTTVADIIGILDHFDARRAHIVGHDWGAVLAWALAANHPDRVDRLVILNGPHPAVLKRAVLTNPRQLARMWYVLAFQFPWHLRRA